jgi:hypothetical protein
MAETEKMSLLTQQIGPLPVWGWGVAILGGVGLAYVIRRKLSAPPDQKPIQTEPDKVEIVIPDRRDNPDEPWPREPVNPPDEEADYPGLPKGFKMDCTKTSFRHWPGTNKEDWELNKNTCEDMDKPGRPEFCKRNLVSGAIMHSGTPWVFGSGHVRHKMDIININRANYGLKPLTKAELEELANDIEAWWPGNKGPIPGDLAWKIAQKWNFPYRCPKGTNTKPPKKPYWWEK